MKMDRNEVVETIDINGYMGIGTKGHKDASSNVYVWSMVIVSK